MLCADLLSPSQPPVVCRARLDVFRGEAYMIVPGTSRPGLRAGQAALVLSQCATDEDVMRVSAGRVPEQNRVQRL